MIDPLLTGTDSDTVAPPSDDHPFLALGIAICAVPAFMVGVASGALLHWWLAL